MSEGAEPTDEALAVFNRSHPGREREALLAARRWYFNARGQECQRPDLYFARWSVEDLRARFVLSAPAKPPCPQCEGSGWDISVAPPLPPKRCACRSAA